MIKSQIIDSIGKKKQFFFNYIEMYNKNVDSFLSLCSSQTFS